MMSQPSLELDNPLINRLRDAECSRLCGSTFDQEANEPTYPAHVLGGEEMMLTGATTLVRIPEKATTLSGACRPRDPVDDDQGGARA
jgi:hypothetical protein